jgi:HK97 family phage prohead protease
MKINIREDHVEIEGYVNAIERNSKPLMSRVGRFIERICKGAFKNAIKRNDDIHILLNHNWERDLGSTKDGTLELNEDNIGLHARATITDKEVIEKARNGDLVGWSFGFTDRAVDNVVENGIPTRAVKDLDLYEVSILDKAKTPAYDGTLITARSEDAENIQFRGVDFIDEVNILEDKENLNKRQNEASEEQQDRSEQQEIVEENKTIDYSKYDEIIKEMKGV